MTRAALSDGTRDLDPTLIRKVLAKTYECQACDFEVAGQIERQRRPRCSLGAR